MSNKQTEYSVQQLENLTADTTVSPPIMRRGMVGKESGGAYYDVAVDASGNLQVDVVSGGTSGTQYAEGDTDATITGTAVMWEDAADTLEPVSATKPLPVNIVSGSSSGTQYTEGDTDATLTGTIAMAEGPSDTATPLQVDASKHLQVDIAADSVGIGGGTQYTEGDTDASITGNVMLFESNTTTSAVSTVSTDNPLPVSVTGGGDATAANQTTIIGHVDGIETLLGTIDADTSSIATDVGTIAGDTTSIDAKTPALGQALASSSVPVVLPLAQITTLTPQTDALTDTELRATPVPVSGSLTVDLGANNDVTVTSGTITANLGATDNAVLDDIAANQTDASQKTQIVDGAGNVIGSTSNALDVNIASGASSGTQYTEGDTDTTITGTALMFESNTTTSALSAVSNTTPLPISDAGGAITVDGTVGVSGTVTVDLGANNDVTVTGTVDLGATDNAVLDSIVSNTTYGATTGGGTETGALRVTIANNSTGVVSIDDNGGAITVDGTVTANLSATDNAVLDDIAAKLGTIDTDTGNMATSLGSLDNAVDGNYLNVNLNMAGTDVGIATPVYTQATQNGLVSERVTNTNGTSTAFSNFGATASTYNYIRSIVIYNSSATAGYVDFRDGTAGSILWTMPLPAGGGGTISSESPLFRTSANTALAYDVSGALSTVYISISGFRSTS